LSSALSRQLATFVLMKASNCGAPSPRDTYLVPFAQWHGHVALIDALPTGGVIVALHWLTTAGCVATPTMQR
jgi:hypothetical protein